MAEEGKFSRALSMAGGAEKLAAPGETSVRHPQQAAASGVPPACPEVRKVREHFMVPASNAVMVHDKGGVIAAQFRALRARIVALDAGRHPSVLTITSGTRGEGKTTVAFNLAVALSEIAPKPVVLVDGDMHRPSLHLIVGVQAETGLNEILQNNLDFNGNIYETAVANLDLIPSHPIVPSDRSESELHRNCKQLIDRLRQMYSFVVIDTPPVLAGSQAGVFGKYSDGVAIVARVEKTARQVVKRAEDEVVKAGGRILGCIVTHHKHHIPDFIYRLFGSTPARYYYR